VKVLELVESKRRNLLWSEPPGDCQVISFRDSRSYALNRLHSQMIRDAQTSTSYFSKSLRPFTQEFCRLARAHAGLTEDALCAQINDHPGLHWIKKLPGAYRFYPFTPTFISDLENRIHHIGEYNPYGGGFLGIGCFGVPTFEVAQLIAEICDCSHEFRRFEDWCLEYERSEIQGAEYQ